MSLVLGQEDVVFDNMTSFLLKFWKFVSLVAILCCIVSFALELGDFKKSAFFSYLIVVFPLGLLFWSSSGSFPKGGKILCLLVTLLAVTIYSSSLIFFLGSSSGFLSLSLAVTFAVMSIFSILVFTVTSAQHRELERLKES